MTPAATRIDWAARCAQSPPPPYRAVFMGSPQLAVPLLDALLDDPRSDVVAVVTQPDKPAGRGQRPHPPPVKARALARGVATILQPERLGDARVALTALSPDIVVVAAYGKLLPGWLLDLPRVAPLNLHYSLLPRHRGAAPIQAAILAGDARTGVTLMGMEPGLDDGPILLAEALDVAVDDTAGTLTDRLAACAVTVLRAGLNGLAARSLVPRPQDPGAVTVAPKLAHGDARIDWHRPAVQIDRLVRAMAPRPGARATFAGEEWKILSGRVAAGQGAAGVVLASGADGIVVACGSDAYAVTQVQAPGRRALAVGDFLHGRPLRAGDSFAA